MAEILLNDAFLTEVDAFRASGSELTTVDTGSVSTGDLSLPTVDAYQDRLARIGKLMLSFQKLTAKDARDMDSIAAKLKAADAAG